MHRIPKRCRICPNLKESLNSISFLANATAFLGNAMAFLANATAFSGECHAISGECDGISGECHGILAAVALLRENRGFRVCVYFEFMQRSIPFDIHAK